MSEQICFRLAGLTLSVFGYEYPKMQDFWDGNWLFVEAELETTGCRIKNRGSFVRTDELSKFQEELALLKNLETSGANLECMEPCLRASVSRVGGLGELKISISLTPDNLRQSHTVEFASDMSDLTTILNDLRQITRRYPIRGQDDV